jgi:hypothetical protein
VNRGTPGAESLWWTDRLGDGWGWLAHPRFSPSLWMRLRPFGDFSLRVRTVRLRGLRRGMVQLLQEEDSRTFAEEGLPCRHLAMVCDRYCKSVGSRRWRRGKWVGVPPPPQPPPPTRQWCWASLVQCRVVAAAAAAATISTTSSFPLGPRPRVQSERPLGRQTAPGAGLGWGYHPCWAVRLGVSSTRRVPGPSPIQG